MAVRSGHVCRAEEDGLQPGNFEDGVYILNSLPCFDEGDDQRLCIRAFEILSRTQSPPNCTVSAYSADAARRIPPVGKGQINILPAADIGNDHSVRAHVQNALDGAHLDARYAHHHCRLRATSCAQMLNHFAET